MDGAGIEAVFWRVMLEEFPDRKAEAQLLERAYLRAIEKGLQREFNRECARFLEENAASGWLRYDVYLKHWGRDDPRAPVIEDDEVVDGQDFREAGELLAHRITMVFYAVQRRMRYLDNVQDRPYWRLERDDTCPGCRDDPAHPQRWDSSYWQGKQLPCEWLHCRSRIYALTAKEAEGWR